MNAALHESRWKQLFLQLDPRGPADSDLYVQPKGSCASKVARRLLTAHQGREQFLLVGARGGGKSTELRQIVRRTAAHITLSTIDLDRSGGLAHSVSAFDLLYISALALIQHIPSSDEQTNAYKLLAASYAGTPDAAATLGDLPTALSGLAGFTEAAAATAMAVGLSNGLAPALGMGLKTVSAGIRLISRDHVVADASQQGRGLLEACRQIVRIVRSNTQRPVCVLIDGLENLGEDAPNRFDAIFTYTQLLAQAPWSSVIAAPPSTMTQPNSVDGRGFTTVPVWGFAPDECGILEDLLSRRLSRERIDPARDVESGALTLIAKASGGLPRHAIHILKDAVWNALETSSSSLTRENAEAGVRELGIKLARGLSADDFKILAEVGRTSILPRGDLAPRLFADGRILTYAPEGNAFESRFAIAPVLVDTVKSVTERLGV